MRAYGISSAAPSTELGDRSDAILPITVRSIIDAIQRLLSAAGAWLSTANIRSRPLERSELVLGLRAAIAPFLVSRALVWLGTEFGARFLTAKNTLYLSGLVPRPALVPFFHWDSDYYASIVRYGYAAAPAGVYPAPYRVAFFPLYPAMARLAGGSDVAMLLIPNVCFLLAIALLYVVAKRRLDSNRAQLTLWVASLGPSAMFFSYPYTESLLLLLFVGAFLLVESGHVLWAGMVGLAAALTRFPGVLVAAALGVEAIATRRAAAAVAALLPLVGLVAVGGLDWAQMGDPFGFYRAQAFWVGPPRSPLHILGAFPKAVLDRDVSRPEALGIPILVVFALGAIWVAMRMPAPYGIFAASQVLLAARQGWYLHFFYSVPRYLLVVFPCYFAFATLLAHRRNLQIAWLVLSVGLLLTYSALFGAGRFIG